MENQITTLRVAATQRLQAEVVSHLPAALPLGHQAEQRHMVKLMFPIESVAFRLCAGGIRWVSEAVVVRAVELPQHFEGVLMAHLDATPHFTNSAEQLNHVL